MMPVVGAIYVCRSTAPPGWGGERVMVAGVSREQKTARVHDMPKLGERFYETVVSWDDLVPDGVP